jgi:CcmD family protein
MQPVADTLTTAQDTTIALLNPHAAQALATQPPHGIERVMLSDEKLPVVLAVVLVIWFGLLLFLFFTDRRLARVERDLRS